MEILNFIEAVPTIDTERNYWFVRTDSGEHYEDFMIGNFIAIGWDYITLADLKNPESDAIIKDKIYSNEKLDKTRSSHKTFVTSTLKKLKTFYSLKKDDIVIIPDIGSKNYAFGRVKSFRMFLKDEMPSDLCEYNKRKSIEWITTKKMTELDPIFYKMRFTRHAISPINEYCPYIERVISNLYVKDNFTHFVIDINQAEGINVEKLVQLINNLQKLNKSIDKYFEFNEVIKENTIKLNLQSKGIVEVISPVGKSLRTLVLLLSITCCSSPNEKTQIPEDLIEYVEQNKDTIAQISDAMDELKVDKQKINKFKNGY